MDTDDCNERRDDAGAVPNRTPDMPGGLRASDETGGPSTGEPHASSPGVSRQESGIPVDAGWATLGTGEPVRLATRGARLAARVIDTVILAVVLLVVVAIARDRWIQSDLLHWLVIIIFSVPYEVAFTALTGQTLGKLALRIAVIRLDNGEPPGWRRSIQRWVLPMALASGGMYVSGSSRYVALLVSLLCYVSLIWDRSRRGIHDHYAGTVVIRD